ncbi:MAG: RNA 2'-phosphotransferase [Promethearchaeota archaeon]|nr:MAG: RNA 2'-phosphotransferase [Candidatus Lokiarchaeota archaeon]
MKKEYVKISKFLSYILRHNPYKYDLKLDKRGFTSLSRIIRILNHRFKDFNINKQLLQKIIQKSDKERFQIIGERIRALYGHSIPEQIQMEPIKEVPKFLYHGTTKKAFLQIKEQGLKNKSRQYVHLSNNIDDAIKVGKRRTNKPIILLIDTQKAKKASVKFYKSGDIYLSNFVPPEFIEKIK